MFVCLTYIHYPVSIGRYFRAAFERCTDVELITAGHYTGFSIPWGGGMTLPYHDKPHIELPAGMQYNMSDLENLIQAKYGRLPDLYVQIDAAFHLMGKPKSARNFMVATDSHCLGDWYDYNRKTADKFFNMHGHYMKSGDIWLPYAYDPIWHRKIEDSEKTNEYDVGLVGVPYTHRVIWQKSLSARGVKVLLENGACYEDMRDMYKKCRIGFNWSSLNDLNARSFELKALGLPVVENEVPDLFKIFKADETNVFPSTAEAPLAYVKDAVKAVQNLLENPERMSLSAKRGYEAVQPHTYDARVEVMLTHV